MLNQRLQGEKYVRFIYVIKDEVLNELQHAKFFDYILPIVPGMNKKKLRRYLPGKILRKVNKKTLESFTEKLMRKLMGRYLLIQFCFILNVRQKKVWFIWQPHI